MSALKGVGIVSNALMKWLADEHLAPHITCDLDEDFAFSEEAAEIYWSPWAMAKEEWDILQEVLKVLGLTEEINPLIFCFLHKIGHYYTLHDFTDEERDNYEDIVDEMSQHSELTREDYLNYYTLDIEIAATDWAVKYIKARPASISALYVLLAAAFDEFYGINEIEVEDE